MGELYDRFGRLVFSMALNSLADHSLAEDITQDVFLRVWKKADQYQPEKGKVSTWLVSITRHRCIDWIRKQNYRPDQEFDPWALEESYLLESPQDIEDEVELRQRQNKIRSAISQLPFEQRRVLSYAFFQGYSHSMIAEAINEPVGTVKTRIRLGMQKLRQMLRDEFSNGG